MASNNNNNVAILEAAKTASAGLVSCPREARKKYHFPEACLSKPSRPNGGDTSRGATHRKLNAGGIGASLVPDAATRICPLSETESLESPTAIQGFDTTWIVENTSSKVAVVAWVLKGVEVSPFEPGLSPMDDPKCLLKPGDWVSIPTFESFVYHVREVDKHGPGRLVLQHRAGMIPLGGKNAPPQQEATNHKLVDPEPFSQKSLEPKPPKEETGRVGTHTRPCNAIDVGFRNMAGFPLSVYWAGNLVDVPEAGFSCAETYHFHMGLNPAPQDFMWDWASQTKYEGSFIGHTFVARRADDPSVVVDKFTLEPTRIIDCPRKERAQELAVSLSQEANVQNQEGCPNDAADIAANNNANGDETSNAWQDDFGASSSSSRGFAAGLSGSSGFA